MLSIMPDKLKFKKNILGVDVGNLGYVESDKNLLHSTMEQSEKKEKVNLLNNSLEQKENAKDNVKTFSIGLISELPAEDLTRKFEVVKETTTFEDDTVKLAYPKLDMLDELIASPSKPEDLMMSSPIFKFRNMRRTGTRLSFSNSAGGRDPKEIYTSLVVFDN